MIHPHFKDTKFCRLWHPSEGQGNAPMIIIACYTSVSGALIFQSPFEHIFCTGFSNASCYSNTCCRTHLAPRNSEFPQRSQRIFNNKERKRCLCSTRYHGSCSPFIEGFL